jgi:hypothetical protein
MLMHFLDALAEPSFERMPDGRLIFFGWFGRGYEISERIYRTLRRESRWMIGMVLFGYPLVTFLSVGHVGVYPVMAFVALTALLGNLRIAWLIRGLPRTTERRSARESRARTAAALSHRAIWGITIAFLAIATVSLGIAVVEEEPVFIVLAALYVGSAVWIGGGLFRLKRRSEERSR